MDDLLERGSAARLIESLIAAPPRTWDPEIDDTLVCRATRRETHDVMTFIFEAPQPRVFAYRPGQFMTFEFEIGGQAINRCYTIASAPTRPHRLEITVKKIPGAKNKSAQLPPQAFTADWDTFVDTAEMSFGVNLNKG